MGSGNELTVCIRKRIVELKDEGKLHSEVARIFGIAKGTVSKTIKRLNKTGSLRSSPRSDRPKKLTQKTERVIKKNLVNTEKPSAVEVAKQLKMLNIADVAPSTVRRIMYGYDLHGFVKEKKTLFTDTQIKRRLVCKKYADKPDSFWEGVL